MFYVCFSLFLAMALMSLKLWELFDLEADSKEKNNLINENLECVEELKEKLSEWMSR